MKRAVTAGRRALLPAVWVVGLVLVIGLAWHGIGRIAAHLIERHANATAIGYARYVSDVTPQLPATIAERRLADDTRLQLTRLRQLGDVFRFKLFDREGRLVLISDDLDKATPIAPLEQEAPGSQQGKNGYVKDIVLGGQNSIELKDGRSKPDRPDVYVEAYVPLVQQGSVLGVVEVYVDQTAFSARIRSAFVQVGAVVAGLLLLCAAAIFLQAQRHLRERRRNAERLRYLAEHDVLSGALNRASFLDAVQRAAWRHEQGGPGFSVLCIDLDRFKEINDSLGHGAGDAVLCEVSERLQKLLRHGDLMARLGGDEFAVLQSAVRDTGDVQRLAERVVAALAEPFEVQGQRLSCGASVGAAQFGVDAISVAELMHKADLAMYRAKSSGRGRFSFYDAALDQKVQDRRQLARDLRLALEQDAVELHYQPLFDSEGRRVLGYEALMRWTHPQRGPVGPAEFIPLAEETGQIETLGAWALHRACQEASAWPQPLSVSVNLSPAQFRDDGRLLAVVGAALDASGLPPSRLILEITESLLLVNTDSVMKTLEALSAMGVQVAMDDFGTGYSSLAYLWRFPFNKLKIDRAFTQGLGSDNKVSLIVRSIITLAHSMGIRVNAEGVETPVQLHQLQHLGCDELQGFLLGRPGPARSLVHGETATTPPAPALDDLHTQPAPL